MAEGRIDVVIPSYQAERWLADAIASVLAQTDAPLGEVIVVDNGSSDRSAEIAQGFPAPVRCLLTGRTGAGNARNVGIAASRAEVIALLDCDDLLPPGSLASRWAALRTTEAEAAGGQVLSFRHGQALPVDCQAPELRPWRQSAQLAGSMLLRRALLDRVGPLDETLHGADFLDWMLRAEAAGARVHMLDRVVLLRRLHPDSLTQASMAAVKQDYLRILRRHVRRKQGGPG